jgi:glycosyltransferase involved in cell wall biosynthesis
VPLKPRPSVVGAARRVYRRILPLETRHRLDRGVRKVLRRPLPIVEQVQMQQLTAHLEQQCDAGTDAGKFATASELPAVFMFNAVSWNDVTQRQQHFARGLAERGHPVFWLEPAFSPLRSWRTSRPLQQLASGVHMVRLPAATRDVYSVEWNDDVIALMTAALRYTASVYGLGNPVQLINYPRYQPLVARLQERLGWKLASDTLDDQRALAALYSTILGPFEDRLEAGADLLLTSSVIMQERLMPRPSVLLHNAADFDLFSCTTPAGHLQHLPRPIIGFFGALADWLDVDLIHAAAERFPKWTFVYIGPHIFSRTETQVAWIRQTDLPNIVVLPKKDPRDLAAHLAEFDVCTMPFLDIPVTRSMNPVKIYEYLAAGKPCISRDLPEVRHLLEGGAAGLVSLYRTPLEFFERLETAVAEDDPALRERRQVFARQNDWSYRIDTLSALLTELGRRSTPAEPR